MTQNKKILVVDDDDFNLEILVKNLKDGGYETIAFENADDALAYAQVKPDEISLALLDKMMGPKDGVSLMQEMKSDTTLAHIPVVIQSGDVEGAEIDRVLRLGAVHYIGKPFGKDELLKSIDAILNTA